jgi:signal transduction histidine kinase
VRTHSLRRQVIVGILSVELLCAAGFAGAALFHEWDIRMHALDVAIRGRSDSLLGSIQDAEDPEDDVAIDPAELVVPREDVYAVYTGNGRLIGSTQGAPTALIALQGDGITSRQANGRSYRTLERKGMRIIDKPETDGAGIQRPVTIIYSVPTRHVWHEVREAASFYVGASAFLLLFTSLVIIILLRRALSPIQELSAEASAISLRSLSFRAPPSAMRMTELRPLAETLSAVIRGLKDAVDQQNRFLGDAAHELKTAVSIVHSSIQLLLMRNRNAVEYTSDLEAILSDNLRVNELVNRMLEAARFTEGETERTASSGRSADLVEVCQQVLQQLQPILKAQRVKVVTQGELQMPVRSSSDDLDVLVSNLIINAAQHSRDGGLISLNIESVDGFALLIVQDQGHGISPEALPHVFERFYREDASRSRETGGAGLGLSICKAIVEAASGTIEIESTVGQGTTVRVKLPSVAAFSVA